MRIYLQIEHVLKHVLKQQNSWPLGAARGAVIKHVYTINIESIDLIDGRSVGRNLFGGDVFQNSEKIVLILKTVDSLEHSVIDC